VNVKDVSIMSAASTIKSLSALVFYLRYYAFEGQVLIIDEPEVNLHPENQVKIARLLARISNLGIKVIVSTHSDYIIREFNNLIMLGSSKKEKSELLEEFGYEKDELLFNDNIGAYLFENGYAKSIEVGEDGFQVDSIDEVIVKQNNAANKIRWELFEEE
jgi:ABC-type multidrug transport system ATPase subunit